MNTVCEQDSEYKWGPKYTKIQNMTDSYYASITQCTEYARILNMAGF